MSRLTTMAGAFAAACLLMFGAFGSASAAPPSAWAFAHEPTIKNVTLSPDGKHIAAITSADGRTPAISIWETANPGAPPTVLTSALMRIMSVEFVKNDRLGVLMRQTFDYPGTKTHLFKLYITDLQGRKWTPALPETRTRSEAEDFVQNVSSPQILDRLPLDPQNILVVNTRLDGAGDIYKVNIYSGAAERIERGSARFGSPQTDLKGNVRARQEVGYADGKVYIAQWIKNPDSGAWEEHFRSFARDREPVGIVGFTPDPNIALVATNKGRDKVAIYEYDIRQRKILGSAFEHKLFDASDVIQSRNPQTYGQVLGFSYGAERGKVYWSDEKLAAIDAGLRKALAIKTTKIDWTDPGGAGRSPLTVAVGSDAQIIGFSDDLRYVLVEKSGPSLPPEYYLLTDGSKLNLLGRSRNDIDTASLGETRLVQYPARDGLIIPAFLTTPPASFGAGPHPAIILPHGGPWARDEWGWDVSGWTQYFASRGFVVMQPQFRGSQGWGQKLWRAGDAEWGQKMQDDNDDAAKWLVAQNLAAPGQAALFGYSYGGYAAMTAAIRPNGLYKCAIAGAGVAELGSFQNETFENRFIREFQMPTIKGLDPLAHAREVSIPIFLYHGERDQTVPIKESERFVAALKAANKPHKYREFKDMGHQFVTMVPEDLQLQLTEIEAYLHQDCGLHAP